MTKRRSRRRWETAELPKGIGGLPPFPMQGPVAALRVLEHGFEVPLDLQRSELRIGRASPPLVDVQLPLPSISCLHALIKRKRHAIEVIDQGSKNGIGYPHGLRDGYVRSSSVLVNVGDRFALAGVGLLALDQPTHELVPALAAYCGPGRHAELDDALEAVIRSHLLILCGSRAEDVIDLARTLHDHSLRRDYPFTKIDAVPRAHQAIDELCTRAACGTTFLDLTKASTVPLRFARHLFSTHFHLWAMIVAPTIEQAVMCLGHVWSEPRRAGFHVCQLGFFRRQWHQRMPSPTFTKLS